MAVGIERGQTIPDFTLPDPSGAKVSSRSVYMRRNMVVAVLPEIPDDAWATWLDRLIEAMGTVPDQDAFCFVIMSAEWESVVSQRWPQITGQVKLLIDGEGTVRQRLVSNDGRGHLLIADRYGVVFHSAAGAPDEPDLDPAGVPGWVEFIACRCS